LEHCEGRDYVEEEDKLWSVINVMKKQK
jgi:hypothetical protein